MDACRHFHSRISIRCRSRAGNYNDMGMTNKPLTPVPRWAQDVAELIFRDIQLGGPPTEKGLREIVRGQWGRMILEASLAETRRVRER